MGSQGVRCANNFNFDDCAQVPIKPADQLDLTPDELNKEFTRILKGNNPQAPHNIVRFSQKARPHHPHAVVTAVRSGSSSRSPRSSRRPRILRCLATCCTWRATRRGVRLRGSASPAAAPRPSSPSPRLWRLVHAVPVPGECVQEKHVATAAAATGDDEDDAEDDAPKVLRNQFNFAERASQTFNYSLKAGAGIDRGCPSFGAGA